MKHISLPILLLFTSLLFAQDNLQTKWKALDSLEVKGLVESANEKALEIISDASKQENYLDLIKGKIFHYKFYQIKNESAASYILNDLNISISKVPAPFSNVLLSYKADFLKQYYDDNRWKNRNRKEINDPDLTDLETWSNPILLDSITAAFYSSLENEEILIKTPIENFEDLLQEKKLNRRYRPTLFDLLTHQALDFFSVSSNLTATSAKDQYFMKDANLYAPTSQFLKLEFSKDARSSHQRVLRLFQKLESLHTETAPLVYAILARLEYVNTYYTGDQKWQHYENALQEMATDYEEELPTALILLKIAEMYYVRSGETDENEKLLHPDFLKKAVFLSEEIIKKYPNTDSSQMAARLKSTITSISLDAKIPAILSSNEPGRIFLNYKSLDSLRLKIIKVKHDFQEAITYRSRDSVILSKVSKATPVFTELFILPKADDYNNHTTELALPGLEIGNYLIYVSEDKLGKNNFSYSFLQVTDLVLAQRKYDQFQIYKALDRKTGKRISQAKLQFFNNKSQLSKTLLTDEKGEAKESNSNRRYRSSQNLLIKNNDTLSTYYWPGYYRSNNKNNEDKSSATTLLYLDRAIYRPGQKVYFKGVLLKQEEKKTTTVPNEFVEVYVDDPNGEELHFFRLKTNKYGSFNGEFLLPTGGLAGEFSIYTEDDTEAESAFWDKIQNNGKFLENGISFHVEEYKRPTFEVKYDSINEIYQPGDTVSITGQAISFSGAPISNSRLIYEVQRQKQEYFRWYQSFSDPIPVKQDTITTDKDGKFSIQFPALFNENDLKEENLLYKFNITATVTDVSGETREATTSLKLGKKNLLVSLEIAEEVTTDLKLQPIIEATNLNNVAVEVTGSLKIYKLKGPRRILKERLWEAPEIQLIPKDEFIKLFPEEPYESENDPKTWPRDELVYTSDFSISGNFEPEIPLEGWGDGKYLAEVTVDNGNFTATEEKIVTVKDHKRRHPSDSERFSLSIQNSDFREDGYVSLLLQTAYNDLKLEVAAFDGEKKIFEQFIEINGRKELKIPVSDLSGSAVEIQVNGVKNNSAINHTKRISLARDKTFLTIETGTFRNKIEPGSEETWSFKIKNEKDAVPDAEILASMYDASLDQFTTASWETVPKFSHDYLSFPSYNLSNIGNVQSLENRFSRTISYRPAEKHFDRLNLFGFRFNNPNSFFYRQYLNQKILSAKNKNTPTGNTRGSIVDADGLPVPGVNVIIKGASKGTNANFDGEFAIDAEPGDILVFSFVGFLNQEFVVENSKNIYITLEEDSSSLDEVVVVGYGEVAVEESVAFMVVEDNEETLETALSGKVAGLTVTPAAPGGGSQIRIRGNASAGEGQKPLFIVDGEIVFNIDLSRADIADIKTLKGAEAKAIYGAAADNGAVIITTKSGLLALQNVQARKNLDETAFFFPDLSLDSEGNVNFSFTSPEALTQWKLRLLAHTNSWVTGTYEGYVRTQKELSITPNAPRFLREGDSLTFKARISNLSEAHLNGTAMLQLYNALTMEPVDMELSNVNNVQAFSIAGSANVSVSFDLVIPQNVPAVTYRIVAKAGNFSDGEENILPVLSNRMLVKESIPLFVRAGETKTYEFKNLSENTSESLQNQSFSLEYTSNPAWIALQSLPYLMEFVYECSEQTFARLYANSLAATIMNSRPQIKEVFKSWEADSSLVSKLEKNEELKNLILAETPWVRDAQSETVQKQQLAKLFDLEKLENEQKELLIKLERMQNSSGAFPWFSGGRDNYFITRHIVAGLGHLKKLDVPINDSKIIARVLVFLDAELLKAERESYERKNLESFYKSSSALHHLYARSFYLKDIPSSQKVQAIENKILKAQKEEWLQKSIYNKGLLALVLSRFDDKEEAFKIVMSLKESAVNSEEYGMYWKENNRGWFWYNAPIETQALIIEAFAEFPEEKPAIEEMKIWLLQNKRTNHWPTTKATTEATYALLMQGEDWLQSGNDVILSLGSKPISAEKLATTKVEAGTGYQKLRWTAEEMDKSFSNITVENNNTTAGYGGAYWQYFEDLDKIKDHTESPLNVEKELYLNINGSSGKSLKRIDTSTPVKIGDLVTVRLVVKTTADMEYIHLKDMRASGFEPTSVLSEYKYQDGTAYYESTKDAATHFFFDLLRKGTYVLEYTVRANNAGNFSNGITSIESMYAPEFSGHTKAIRVDIDE